MTIEVAFFQIEADTDSSDSEHEHPEHSGPPVAIYHGTPAMIN